MITERLVLEQENNSELIRLHLARYEFAKGFVSGKKVLDVACGSGYGSAILKEAGAAKVIGLDISSDTIKYASAHFQNRGIEFVVENAEDLSSYRDFDVIVSFETIEHLQHPETFLLEITRALTPNGILIISTPQHEKTRFGNPNNPFHVREWTLEEFETLLSKDFNLLNVYGQYGFGKKWFPYSRTVQRLFCRALFPERLANIDSYPVLAQPPRFKVFQLDLAYMVIVCAAKN